MHYYLSYYSCMYISVTLALLSFHTSIILFFAIWEPKCANPNFKMEPVDQTCNN